MSHTRARLTHLALGTVVSPGTCAKSSSSTTKMSLIWANKSLSTPPHTHTHTHTLPATSFHFIFHFISFWHHHHCHCHCHLCKTPSPTISHHLSPSPTTARHHHYGLLLCAHCECIGSTQSPAVGGDNGCCVCDFFVLFCFVLALLRTLLLCDAHTHAHTHTHTHTQTRAQPVVCHLDRESKGHQHQGRQGRSMTGA